MDTKLKNYHKAAIGLITLLILCASLVMTVLAPVFTEKQAITTKDVYTSEEFLDMFIRNNYVLYFKEKTKDASFSPYDIFFSDKKGNTAEEKEDARPSDIIREAARQAEWTAEESYEDYPGMLSFVEQRYNLWDDHFLELASYMEYESRNERLVKPLQSNAKGNKNLFSKTKISKSGFPYAFILSVTYDSKGYVSDVYFFPDNENHVRKTLKSLAVSDPFENFYDGFGMLNNLKFQMPENRTYTYAMTEENLQEYLTAYPDIVYEMPQLQYSSGRNTDAMLVCLLLLGLLVACGALFLPFLKSFGIGDEKIFRAPLELVFLICFGGLFAFMFVMEIALGYSSYNFEWAQELTPLREFLLTLGISYNSANNFLPILAFAGWTAVFALVYWGFACIRRLFTLGPKEYFKKHVLTYRFIRHFGSRIYNWSKRKCLALYDTFLHVDLREDTTKMILKAVIINFLICTAVCVLWFFGIAALVIYSIVLFFLLRKYIQKIQEQYHHLLEATNELAKGNLNGTIPEDLGVFEPFREEIGKIQEGFKKAVDEEVKSTRMKTDLITNVSHDLKTPLTAIITYVDLLKQDDLEEGEREKYIEILDQKANRLKLLIEDLFEVSKATSKAVTLNIMDVDIVSLMQQVKLELQDKIDATDLIFRWKMPEEKVILPLDSQRTYRIFENLLINITKYAMPHTRAYISIENLETQVKITMKNISCTELNFNPNEITERFVRGDVSRNTEGSGLGLAIAKSFTELQGGKLEISTDADLFTVEITFLK